VERCRYTIVRFQAGHIPSWRGSGESHALSRVAAGSRIGHSDVAFTMRQYVQTDLEVHRQVATALAELILGGVASAQGSPAPRRDGPDTAG